LADTTPDFAGFIDASGEELILGGKPVSWWIETFGLPFHVSYAPDIRANLLAFKEVFERLYPKGEVRYAGKASTHPAVFRLAAEAGVGIDVASPYETRCALEAGVPPGQLDVNGNAKDDDLLNLAIGKDMLIVADMPVRVLGFHTHIGSQINDLGAYQLVLGKLLELGATLKSAGHDFEAVNIGGGFPVSYVTQEEWDQILDRIRDGFIAAKAGDPSKIYMWENRPGDFVMGPDGLPTKDWKGELFTARFPKEKMVEAILSNDITVNGRAMKATAALEAAGTPALMIEPGRSFLRGAAIAGLTIAGFAWSSFGAAQADPLLDEMVEFTGQIFFIDTKVPAVVIGAVRNGEVSVRGFGERAGPGSPPPDGDTLLRIGSVTKAFTGAVLAHLTANDTVKLTDPLTQLVPDFASGATSDVQRIRLIDLVTHSAGLPRELPHEPGPDSDPFAPITRDAFAAWLKKEPLLFKPASSVLYSNFGFDLLALRGGQEALSLVKEHITGPLNMKDTVFALSEEQKQRLMQGHAPDGTVLPDVPTGSVIVGSGGLYSTPNDLLRWMQWHLDRFGQKDAEARLLDHGLYLMRDGLQTAAGMDESGHMDALGLAWVGMMAKDDRPFIVQKAGGLQGTFSYIAFAPTRGVAVFIAINKFDFGAAFTMGEFANELLEELAPR